MAEGPLLELGVFIVSRKKGMRKSESHCDEREAWIGLEDMLKDRAEVVNPASTRESLQTAEELEDDDCGAVQGKASMIIEPDKC